MSNWNTAENILCVRLDTIGDVLMTTPAIRALKESLPGRRITLLTSTIGAQVAALVPEIDEVIAYDSPWMNATAPRTSPEPDLAMIELLRERQFEGAVIFTVFSQNPLPSAILCYLAGIPLRLARCRENPYQLLTDWIAETEPEQALRHEVQRQLDLVGTIGCITNDEHLSLRVSELADHAALDVLQRSGVDVHQPWLVVHPGASAASRRYPPELYAQVVGELVLTRGFQVVFTGKESERELVETIQREARVKTYSLVGTLSLEELAAVIELAPLLITNNTGPAHIAAAVGTPVVVLYALTNPQHTTWKVQHRVLYHDVPCKFCFKSICPQGHHNCLRLVSPQWVVQAVNQLYQPELALELPKMISVASG
ncbi:MAG TPA: lipopolysaccharide heptosyltransferase II [Anaerolineae bacterium]|nr:lipopolysaccharide heptosyltransferase II [Anaerolineae bacterium]